MTIIILDLAPKPSDFIQNGPRMKKLCLFQVFAIQSLSHINKFIYVLIMLRHVGAHHAPPLPFYSITWAMIMYNHLGNLQILNPFSHHIKNRDCLDPLKLLFRITSTYDYALRIIVFLEIWSIWAPRYGSVCIVMPKKIN